MNREKSVELMMHDELQSRRHAGNLRELPAENHLIDFYSNDYLGFARSIALFHRLEREKSAFSYPLLGATGSRLLSGNSICATQLEEEIADFHQHEQALLFSSGYAANVGLFSALSRKETTLVMDEAVHASVIDGWRMGFGGRWSFKHNDLDSLESKLKRCKNICFVAVESVYSMDGTLAPLPELNEICHRYGAKLIVDEAHAVGVFGKGLVVKMGLTDQVFAVVVSFGKALGAHGGVILGSRLLVDYLLNFARPFIFSTAMPFAQLLHIKVAYDYLKENPDFQQNLQNRISAFQKYFPRDGSDNQSAIRTIIIPGNDNVKMASSSLRAAGLAVSAVMSPTISPGSERLRICLHAFNSDAELELLGTSLSALMPKNT